MPTELTIVFEPAEEGGYSTFIPEVPGGISEGETLDEAREMVLEALHEIISYRRVKALSSFGSGVRIEHIVAEFLGPTN